MPYRRRISRQIKERQRRVKGGQPPSRGSDAGRCPTPWPGYDAPGSPKRGVACGLTPIGGAGESFPCRGVWGRAAPNSLWQAAPNTLPGLFSRTSGGERGLWRAGRTWYPSCKRIPGRPGKLCALFPAVPGRCRRARKICARPCACRTGSCPALW